MDKDKKTAKKIKKIRKKIDKLDKVFLNILQLRFKLASKLGKIKREGNLSIEDHEREQDLLERWIKQSKLDRNFIIKLHKLITTESKNNQKQ